MKTVKVRELTIGTGQPKICVSITGKTSSEIVRNAQELKDSPADLVEWRCDCYEHALQFQETTQVLRSLRKILNEKPILFTFRTKEEGGSLKIEQDKYMELYFSIIQSGCPDLIDLEVSQGEKVTKPLLEAARQAGIRTILSSHDFAKTVPQRELEKQLTTMQQLEGDIVKIAVMPNTSADVLALLGALEQVKRNETSKPMIGISMGKLGVVSRISGELFGSCITFGTVGEGSAPGQLELHDLKKVLDILHNHTIE
ncbi:MAG: type I 3-dehydroquinate dehydratase [Lachnospiraceae bacterium]